MSLTLNAFYLLALIKNYYALLEHLFNSVLYLMWETVGLKVVSETGQPEFKPKLCLVLTARVTLSELLTRTVASILLPAKWGL